MKLGRGRRRRVVGLLNVLAFVGCSANGCSSGGLVAGTEGVGDSVHSAARTEPAVSGVRREHRNARNREPELQNARLPRQSLPRSGELSPRTRRRWSSPPRLPRALHDHGRHTPTRPSPATHTMARVKPQCLRRDVASTVDCSCRCANVDGRTNDGERYCSCGDGYVCEQLVPSLGGSKSKLAGAYCIKPGTAYDPETGCDDQIEAMAPRKSCVRTVMNPPLLRPFGRARRALRHASDRKSLLQRHLHDACVPGR